ncbi:MAG: poly-gamma-glutamate synthesis protein (capsule biosynthesis protein) [Candidatus Peregrinibacteria bacterium Greene0416_19]|nr:MAG: poly-gamma-glutamate synthesis protein (capsule biosynthesis protein) [Candidatus Peregrinibacteria bacterium Greene0416_19]
MAFSDGNAHVGSQDGVSMLFLGDFVLGSKIAEHQRSAKDWLSKLGEKDGKFFLGADIVGMNFEGPITDRPCTAQTKICLTQNPALLFDFFRNFPMFNLALFANNHVRDAGEEGIDDTYSLLSLSKKLIAGVRENCVEQKIREQEIAVCAFDDSNGSLDVGKAAQAVAEAKLKSDVVIASVHWGIEYTSSPTERQREVATALVRAGAKAIIGHGPHVIQPMEMIDRTPVFYSLGNFLFEQPDLNHSSGLAVGLLTSKEKMQIFLFPIRSTAAQPSLLQGDDRLKALSQILPANEQDEAQNLMGVLEVPL